MQYALFGRPSTEQRVLAKFIVRSRFVNSGVGITFLSYSDTCKFVGDVHTWSQILTFLSVCLSDVNSSVPRSRQSWTYTGAETNFHWHILLKYIILLSVCACSVKKLIFPMSTPLYKNKMRNMTMEYWQNLASQAKRYASLTRSYFRL